MTPLWPIGVFVGLILYPLSIGSDIFAGSLYRCVTDTDGTVYTDNPAQLERCAPITASGAVSSLATVSSGGPPISPLPEPPSMVPALPEPDAMLPPPNMPDQAIAGVPQNAASTSPPCPVGVNPLNPLSAPPCPNADAVPPATITMPPPQDAPPASSTQP